MRRLPLLFALLLAVALVLVGSHRTNARDEEEELNPKKPVKRIVVDDDTPGGAGAIADIVRAATSTNHPQLKKFYASTSVACDRVTLEGGKLLRVLPLPYVWDKDREKFRANPEGFGAAQLDEDNKAGEPQFLKTKDVLAITPFERFAVIESDRLVTTTATDSAPYSDRLFAAERVLAGTLLAHETSVAANLRRGTNWEPFKTSLQDQLMDVRVLIAREMAKQKNWPRLADLVSRYTELYRGRPKVLQVLATLRLDEAAELVKSDDQVVLERARDILVEYESKMPNSGSELAQSIRSTLATKAKKLVESVETTSDKDRARTLLNNAKLLNPDDPSVLAKQKELRAGYSALVVGVPRMPRLMSPATAREDSELMAVELIFEGLLDPIPDDQFGRVYRPLLATHKPTVSPLARELTLVGNASWGRLNAGGVFDAADLVATVELMKARRALPSADAADWLTEVVPDTDDPTRVRVKFASAHPDPRQVLAFKILPGKYLAGKTKSIDDQVGGDSFARVPFGTGPFRLTADFVPAQDERPVKDISFVPNSNYRRRPGRFGEPELSEIRFVPTAGLKSDDLIRSLTSEQIHILPDVPTVDLEKYRVLPKMAVVTPTANRRTHILAVNNTVPALQSSTVRRGISLAIDRESILDEVYRAGTKHHHALAGPYPVGSWLAPTGLKPAFDRDLAAGLLRNAEGKVTLLFPDDDPRAEVVCKRIATAVKDCGKLEVVPEGVSPVELRTRVEQQGRYELAYIPFDYPDIWHAHALAAMLDPSAAGSGGRNFNWYRTKGTVSSRADDGLTDALAELKTHRDVEGEIKKVSRDVFDRFNEAVPFIPLWQLDRHMVVSTWVKVYFDGKAGEVPYEQLDPITLFGNVSRWKLQVPK